jgi:uncharacterized membrane protein/glutaredoxin
MLTVTLYTRQDCHLCDLAKSDLRALQKKVPHRLVEVDIDSEPALKQAYDQTVPVIEVGPYRLTAPFGRQDLLMTLSAADDRRTQLEQVGDRAYQTRLQRGQTFSRADRLSYWLSKHYLAMINLLIFLYVGLPFLAPVLMEGGATSPASAIYTVYSPLCHQFGFRSWYLFGEQAFYPHAAANVAGVQTFEQVTGITDQNDPYRAQARAFRGSPVLGYKVALCERDVAIYGAMLAFGLIYAASRKRLPPLHWALWLLIGLGPIGLDGFSQLISQLNLPALAAVLPYRESTPFLRTLTGFLFGFCTAWFAYPYIEEGMRETRQFFAKKFAVVRATD